MSATLRIHRGPAMPERILLVDGHPVATLTEDPTDVEVSKGRHLIALKLGFHHSIATALTVHDGDVVDLTVEENPEAIMPILQGGYLRFHQD